MLKLFTDSSANIPEDRIRSHDIGMLSFSYLLNDREYVACDPHGAPFDGKAFYDQLRAGAVTHTSMVNTASFLDAFEPYLKAGTDLLYIGMSSGISGTYHAAATAVDELREKYPERLIAAVDTRAASLGEGLIVLDAAEMIAGGQPFDAVVARAQALSNTMCQLFTVDDLHFLRRGGRISGVAAIAGTILHIKPILWGNELGQIVLSCKVRGRKQSINTLAERYAREVADHTSTVGIAHGDCLPEAEHLAQLLREQGHTGEILTVCYEPVTGSHVGPGTIALFFHGGSR